VGEGGAGAFLFRLNQNAVRMHVVMMAVLLVVVKARVVIGQGNSYIVRMLLLALVLHKILV
jgi:hypothetical protein